MPQAEGNLVAGHKPCGLNQSQRHKRSIERVVGSYRGGMLNQGIMNLMCSHYFAYLYWLGCASECTWLVVSKLPHSSMHRMDHKLHSSRPSAPQFLMGVISLLQEETARVRVGYRCHTWPGCRGPQHLAGWAGTLHQDLLTPPQAGLTQTQRLAGGMLPPRRPPDGMQPQPLDAWTQESLPLAATAGIKLLRLAM